MLLLKHLFIHIYFFIYCGLIWIFLLCRIHFEKVLRRRYFYLCDCVTSIVCCCVLWSYRLIIQTMVTRDKHSQIECWWLSFCAPSSLVLCSLSLSSFSSLETSWIIRQLSQSKIVHSLLTSSYQRYQTFS